MQAKTKVPLTPLALRNAPALIETVFPAQKVSFEAQKERKANLGQTLTGLGSYWKGRKPLILVRSIVLGSLLPPTDNPSADLAIFEKLMAFDDEGLARRALAANAWSATALQEHVPISDPERYFSGRGWRRDTTGDQKLDLYRLALKTLKNYEEKASLAKRPEEVDQEWLYAPVWSEVTSHYAHLGLDADSFAELVEQLGILRYGHRPRVGDAFSGGGSIPFESARIGCDIYASDLNPIACMLTWGALNVIGSSAERKTEIEKAQKEVARSVDDEITKLGIEHDGQGNRAKAYLYCLEARCPESGWLVPLSPTWVISKRRNVIAQLKPDHRKKQFEIKVINGASDEETAAADVGTIQSGHMNYDLAGRTYSTSIKTLRGDYRSPDGSTGNRLRHWERSDFKSNCDDIFNERLYAIHWITKDSLNKTRQKTYFAAPSEDDQVRERFVENFVAENLSQWQENSLVPDMLIEPGEKTDEPIRTRGWTYWHHMFNARQLLLISRYFQHNTPEDYIFNAKSLDWNSRIANWMNHWEKTNNVFYNQALNTFYNYGTRCFSSHEAGRSFGFTNYPLPEVDMGITCVDAAEIEVNADIWITDPPYADAVNYHEITEYFIAWLRKNPPKEFEHWIWDSRRALAIKGSDEDFRRNMVMAYEAMAKHMPSNGVQCVMFTHQDTKVWGDLVSIFWAAGLQVTSAWYIATETNAAIKKGSFVQGTVILMLRKRAAGERAGFKQRLLPAVRLEVARQIEAMMNLNEKVEVHHGEPVFNDLDLQMAGYAAALKVLTAYTHIGGEDATGFALRPRVRGETTVVDEIVQQAAETASNLLIPDELQADTWARLSGIERFMLRMLDMETIGSAKLDNYQNFAKAFRVEDYARVMGDTRPNHARLKRIGEYASRDLTDSTEIGATRLGRLIVALQQLLEDTEPQVIVEQLRNEMADFLEARPLLVDMLTFVGRTSSEPDVRNAADVLGSRLKNLRFGD